MPESAASAFIQELQGIDDWPAWIVGRVVAGSKKARLVNDLKIIPIPYRPLPIREPSNSSVKSI